MRKWLLTLSRAVEEAQQAGHLQQSVRPQQFAFEIYSLAIGAHWGHQMLGDKKALTNVRSTILGRIRALSAANCPSIRKVG